MNFKDRSLQYHINYFALVVFAAGLNFSSLLWLIKLKDFTNISIFLVLFIMMSGYSIFSYDALVKKIKSGNK